MEQLGIMGVALSFEWKGTSLQLSFRLSSKEQCAMRSVAIAEDQRIFREGLKALLTNTHLYDVVCEACNGVEAISCVERYEPELLLLDLSMPILGGMSVIKEIKSRFPKTKILIMTMHNSEEYIREGLQLGANGYCLKDCGREEFVAAIEKVLSGSLYLSPGLSEHILIGYMRTKPGLTERSAWERLTGREKEVLKLIGEGYRSKQIGEVLSISIKTVEKHRSNIAKKLNIHSIAALTAFAYEKGLITHAFKPIDVPPESFSKN